MKPTALIIISLFLAFSSFAQKQISGTIYFADSSSQSFVNMEFIKYFYYKNDIVATQSKVLKVSGNKSEKNLKCSQISKIKLISYEINENENYLRNVTIEVTTKKGEIFQGNYKFLDSIKVLTTDNQSKIYYFGLDGALNISSIGFD